MAQKYNNSTKKPFLFSKVFNNVGTEVLNMKWWFVMISAAKIVTAIIKNVTKR